MRSTRDLLRRRLFFARKRGELLAHIQYTNTQHNLEPFENRIDRVANRDELLEHFAEDEDLQMSIAADMALLDRYEETIEEFICPSPKPATNLTEPRQIFGSPDGVALLSRTAGGHRIVSRTRRS